MSPDRGAQAKAAAPAAFPSGEVTFLFSDIEGSTQRWEAHADAMKAAVARHEQLMNGAIASRGGYVFKLVGDAFCAAFRSAPDAIGAAIDAQRSLAEEDFSSVDGLHVRMGVHTGRAEERNADYFGPTVNRVARLMSIGHGGQVLLSGAVADALHDVLPSDATLIDFGLRRLKDLTQPEQVWQLAISGLRSEFPPLNSLDARANNLPMQVTSLFGREQDVEDVKSLLAKHRLLTLFGAGGVGKTRLALQVGADLLDRYPDGVWFADLAPISDPELVASVIASVVGMPQRAGQRVDEAIPLWLKRKNLLLILDNCEHLLEVTARLADAIMRTCPDVRLLATSRQALGIDGEVVHRLPSLAVPNYSIGLRSSDGLQYGALALFVDRAKAADTRFALTDNTAPVVADICRRLDGIPLAIELAAARVNVLSIPNLAQRLDDRFKILTGGSRTALPRQKTLGALIDWSYDLLTPREQVLFDRVGIFAGGFSLDATTNVCGGEGLNEVDVLDLLSSLTDKSLVVADTAGEQERYHLLESTRAYSLEKLASAGEHDRLARSHAGYFRNRAEAADRSFSTSPRSTWLAREELEIGNYRAALEWALTDGKDVPLGAAIAGYQERLWTLAGLMVEGRYWIGRAQAGLDEATHPREAARLWLALATLSHAKPRRDYAERALALYESLGDRHGSASTLLDLAYALFQMGRLDESASTCARALVAKRECGDTSGVAGCLTRQGSIQYLRGEIAEARDSFAQALVIYKAIGSEGELAALLGNLAELEFVDGHVDKALHNVREALAIDIRGKDAVRLAIDYTNLGAYCIAIGDMDEARQAVCEGLLWALKAQHALGIAIVLQHFALALRGS
jgi:predicted ATPase/class 3 adenylate cyclase